MKPILFLLLLAIILSCKKESVSPLQEKLQGRWELNRRWGTVAGIDESYPPGNGTILQFSSNNFYDYSGTQLLQSGTFTMSDDNTSYSVKGARINFHMGNGGSSEKFMIITDTTLTFSDYATDAEFKQYRRL